MIESLSISEIFDTDLEAITRLFIDCVHSINIKDYSQEQINCWAPKSLTADDFKDKLEETFGFKATFKGDIVGFVNLYPSGFIGHLYVHKDYQHLGIGKALVFAVIKKALSLNLTELQTEASITSYRFFKKIGFNEELAQLKLHKGIYFKNYKMTKHLK